MFYNLFANSIIFVYFFSFFLTFLGLKYLIRYLRIHRDFQPIRKSGPQNHLTEKKRVPTMGGIILSFVLFLNIFLFCDLTSPHIIILLILIISFSFIGFLDDFVKVFYKNTDGFKGSKKLILQLAFSGLCMLYLIYCDPIYLDFGINIPVINFDLRFSCFIVAIYMILITGSSNATNITDGLDGLLSLPVFFISITMQIICILFLKGYTFSNILINPELIYNILIVLTSISAIFLCFLIFNRHPAKIFMGDVGSLMIGAVLCYISILLKIEFLYGIMALLFVIEILSTVLQVGYYKITKGKRLFKMAPFHHHLEQSGLTETSVVRILWFFSFLCCILSIILFILT